MFLPARSKMTWSSKVRSEKWGMRLAHSTRVKSCLSAAWHMLVTGSFVYKRNKVLCGTQPETQMGLFLISSPTQEKEGGWRSKTTYRVLHVHVPIRFCFWFHSKFSFQNPLHGHVFMATTGTFCFALGSLPAPLPFLLHSWHAAGYVEVTIMPDKCGKVSDLPKLQFPHESNKDDHWYWTRATVMVTDETKKAKLLAFAFVIHRTRCFLVHVFFFSIASWEPC
jgi:hypothetical protein